MRRIFFPGSWHSLILGVTFCSLTWYLCSTSFLVVAILLEVPQSFSKASNFLKWYWDLFYANLRIGRVLSGCQKLSYIKQALSDLYCDQRQGTWISWTEKYPEAANFTCIITLLFVISSSALYTIHWVKGIRPTLFNLLLQSFHS